MEFGTWLQKTRVSKCLTQQALADVTGVARGTIFNLENNICSPKLSTLAKILNYFDLTLEEVNKQLEEEN